MELIDRLKNSGITKITGTKKELQELCQSNHVPITSNEDIIVKGWVNKPKGAIQILFERGWLDPTLLYHYTKDGKNDMSQDQNSSTHHLSDPISCSFSVRELMKLQNDFISELTLLQYHGNLLWCLKTNLLNVILKLLVRALSIVGVCQSCGIAMHQLIAKRPKKSFGSL